MLFTPFYRFFSNFPSQYFSLPVSLIIFKLSKWSCFLGTRILVSRSTLFFLPYFYFNTPLLASLFFSLRVFSAFFIFAHHYLWNHLLFSFPPATEMVHFAWVFFSSLWLGFFAFIWFSLFSLLQTFVFLYALYF